MAMMQELWTMLEAGQLNAQQRQWFEAPGEERLYDLQEDPFELNNLAADPAYGEILERMRAALDKWQQRVEDWSEQPEEEMLAGFHPDGEVPVTAAPEIVFRDGQLHLSCTTGGASIGYSIDGGAWQLYRGPVKVAAGEQVEAKAVRYGWDESETVAEDAP
jgi:hypothetical protein